MQKLRVYPNPWKATDRDGLPCAVVPTDPEGDGGAPGQYVGARVDRKRTEVLQDFGEMADHELRSPMQRTRYQYQGIAADDPELGSKLFSTAPIELPPTRYYKQRLREGALIAADRETAELARLRAFVPVEELRKRHAPKSTAAPSVESAGEATAPTSVPLTLAMGAKNKSKSKSQNSEPDEA